MDTLINRARGVATVMVASLALSAIGIALENSFDGSAAEAETPSALLHRGGAQPKQVQEYVRVVPSDAGGAALPKFPKNTFVFLEQCKDGSRKVSRKVTANSAVQPLGKCNVGGPVTVTDEQPLRGSWEHMSKVRRTISKATRKNNHSFVFIEQAKDTSTPPSTPNPTPPPPPGGETGDPYAPGNVGVDISWPQCGTPNETPSGFDFGIVGVNNGLWFTTNPCLVEEAANFPGKKLNLYVNTEWNSSSPHVNTSYPRTCTTGDEVCAAYDTGYNAGLYAVNAVTTAGISVNVRYWEDEEENATWSPDTAQNAASIQGEHDALIDGGATGVGDYSTTVQYNDITGGVQNGDESWGATTFTTGADAQTNCTGHQFTGGPSKLMQFTPTTELDEDVAC